jgi:peptidoglycan/LPS O-acetylase OafA/YrhL
LSAKELVLLSSLFVQDSLAPAAQTGAVGSTALLPDEPSNQPGSSRPHLPLLDGLRGLAILMVLVFHVVHISGSPAGIDRLVRKITVTGWMGVDLFFVLSGFLITGILLDAKSDPHYFRNFYLRRVLRIFPLNYAFLIGILILLPRCFPAVAANLGNPPPDTWSYWLFLGNFGNVFTANKCAALGALWSLAIEEQFYLVWPLIVLILYPRALGRVCIAILILSPVLREILVLRGVSYDALKNLTFSHMDPLVVGAFLAVAKRDGGLQRFLPAAWTMAIVMPAALVLMSLKAGGMTESRIFQIFGFSVVSLTFGSFITLALERARIMSMFNLAWLRWFGRRSYSIYLFNLPLIYILNRFVFDPDAATNPGHAVLPRIALFFALTIIACVVVATVSWHLFEKHWLGLKSFFPMVHCPAVVKLESDDVAIADAVPAL